MQQVFRVGAYGIVRLNNKLLVITQERGPYKDHFDLPGGAIEFGETPEEALKREFMEETGMEIKASTLVANLSHKQDVPSINDRPPFKFHQLGLIYKVEIENTVEKGCLKHAWIDLDRLKSEKTSPILGKIINDLLT